MALILNDRVKQETTTTGTGTITLGTQPAGYQSFAAGITNGSTVYYAIANTEASTTEWEVGLGTFSSSGAGTVTRDTVYTSSNSNNKTNFGAGTKEIFVTYPASRSLFKAADNSISLAGPTTFGSTVLLNQDPTLNLQATTKQYVDNSIAAGLDIHTAVRLETTGALSAGYSNGSSGVGATLTNSGTQAALVIDSVAAVANNRVLVQQQSNAAHNGIYVVTNIGSGSVNWILTRSTDANTFGLNTPTKLGQGSYVFVTSGNTRAGQSFVCNTVGTITFGTTNITFAQFFATPVYTGTAPINVTGQVIALTGVVGPTKGGTGLSSLATGNLLYGTGSNTWGALGLGAAYKVLVVNSGGSQLEWGTVALNQSAAVSGALGVANAGTGLTSYTLGDLIYASGSATLAKLAGNTTTTKKYLQEQGNGSAAAAPSWQQVAAADISGLATSATTDTTNAANISSGTLPAARLSGSYTGITGVGTLTAGTWSASTIALNKGGTGATTASDARDNLGVEIGVNVQAYDADLTAIGGLAKTDGNFIVGNGSTWVAENGATVRTSLGLGTAATTAASAYATAAQGTKADNALAKASNLSDLANVSTARDNLGVQINDDVIGYVTPSTSGNVLTSNGSAWTSAAISSIPSTLGVTGLLTANAGVVVDELTIDADTITATDDFIIDAAGDITLDAGGGDVNFADDGTGFAFIARTGNNAIFGNPVSDGKILIQGSDGGTGQVYIEINPAVLEGLYAFHANGTAGNPVGMTLTNDTNGATLSFNTTFNGKDTQTFRFNGTQTGSIVVGSSVAYNTSSDYRLKQNVNYSWNATTECKKLKPCQFKWINDVEIEDGGGATAQTITGFLAHELQTVVPEAVSGVKDATETYINDDGDSATRIKPQGIDQSKIISILTKTIQELEARITAGGL